MKQLCKIRYTNVILGVEKSLYSFSCLLFYVYGSQFLLQTSGRKSRNVSIVFMFSFGKTYVFAVRTVRFPLRSRRFFVTET